MLTIVRALRTLRSHFLFEAFVATREVEAVWLAYRSRERLGRVKFNSYSILEVAAGFTRLRDGGEDG